MSKQAPVHKQVKFASEQLSQIEVSKAEVYYRLKQLVKEQRRHYLLYFILTFLPVAIMLTWGVCLILRYGFDMHNLGVMLYCGALFVLLMLSRWYLVCLFADYQNIQLETFIEHLNIRFPILEHSAQLIFLEYEQLSSLQRLQQHKVTAALHQILLAKGKPCAVQAQLVSKKLTSLQIFTQVAVISIIAVIEFNIDSFISAYQNRQLAETIMVKPASEVDETFEYSVELTNQYVEVYRPEYSVTSPEERVFKGENLDIVALSGSDVLWEFTFSQHQFDYYLVFSNGERYRLDRHSNNRFRIKKKIIHSVAYHIDVVANDGEIINKGKRISQIYTIKSIADKAPKIRFITPKNTVTELNKTYGSSMSTQVHISDDFAISHVEILASIAKGSGESVKFRDQTFKFDFQQSIDNQMHYFKQWNLQALKMEPGDELYFTVVASDNRLPEPQQTRSETKIIRWLDDDQEGIIADGIVIDFMPEYFKSQRQIIIETIELIEDKSTLAKDRFVELSELLGVAQSELKEKYGQYLGDESEGVHNVDIDSEHALPDIHIIDDHGGSNAVITASEHHEEVSTTDEHHHDAAPSSENLDRSGRMALINQYGHNHEDSDVGVMTSDDPRAFMKKSLENMWQAELHLMLSEPSKALPFEQKALMFLKRAKKAERIYVKRLGFEPPPVTEQRRYQGELTDIRHKRVLASDFSNEKLSDKTTLLFSQLLVKINEFQQKTADTQANNRLSDKTLSLVKQVKVDIQKILLKRPGMIDALKTLEYIVLQQSFALNQCIECLDILSHKLTVLLPNAVAVPSQQKHLFMNSNRLVEGFAKQHGEFQ